MTLWVTRVGRFNELVVTETAVDTGCGDDEVISRLALVGEVC